MYSRIFAFLTLPAFQVLLHPVAKLQAQTAPPACHDHAAIGVGTRTGRLLVTNQQSKTVSIIDLSTRRVTQVPLPDANPHGGAVSPDGRWGVVADYGKLAGFQLDGNRLFVIDMGSGKVIRTINTGDGYRALHDLVFVGQSSSRIAVTAQRFQHVLDVDVARGVVLGAMDTRGISSHSLALAADGRTLFTANEEEQFVSRLDLERKAFMRAIPLGAQPLGIAISPDGATLWVGTRGSVRIIDVKSDRTIDSIPGVLWPDDLAFSADGSIVAIPDSEGDAVHIVDARERKVTGSIGLDHPVSVYVHPDNRTIYVTQRAHGTVAVLDAAGLCQVTRFETGVHPDEVGWGPIR